jgi:hypothetical protein
MQELDPQVIHQLRVMAGERRAIGEMVRKILSMRDFTVSGPIDVLRYFREAFGLTLPQAKPVADWLAYGGSEAPDADLNSLVWPFIKCNRDSWSMKSGAE